MKKRVKIKKLSRKRGGRKALLKSLAQALFEREKIRTTRAKAKALIPFAEKCITDAKKRDLLAFRRLSRLFIPKTVRRLITDLAPRYEKRKGGYVRMIKLGPRKSDAADMVIVELIEKGTK